jgi:hypothetical protein
VSEKQCVAGCKVFTGGERKHHRDCPYYPESLTKIWHDTEADYLSEIARLTQENERMRRENADLLGSLRDLYNLISDSNAPTFIANADYDKITNAAVLISLATPIPDPAGGMPVEVECVRCSEPTVESDFNGYCPVCHDDMGAGDA